MASFHVASRSLEPFLKDKYQEVLFKCTYPIELGCRVKKPEPRRLVNH